MYRMSCVYVLVDIFKVKVKSKKSKTKIYKKKMVLKKIQHNYSKYYYNRR